MHNDIALKIENLNKKYNSLTALNGVDLEVKKGDFFGLLGPNGAGKSTIINVLCSLIKKNSGTITICGDNLDNNPSAAKAHIGVVPQELNLSIFETCLNILLYQAGFYGISRKVALPRAKKLLKILQLSSKINVQAMKLSGGMKRRLMIARALMHEPEVLILDEPTAGVDVEIRHTIWNFLRDLNNNGTTIILTTHYLEEAEILCNKIAIINDGRIIENTTTKDIIRKLDENNFVITLKSPLKTRLKKSPFILHQKDEITLEATILKDQSILDLLDHLKANNIQVADICNKTNRLEQLFLKLTKKSQ